MLAVQVALAIPAGGAGNHAHHSKVAMILIGVAFVVIGGINAAKPQWAYKLNSWQYKRRENWEPSAAGLLVARVIGAVAVVVGIVLIVIGVAK